MEAFLLTWNPARYEWKELRALVNETKAGRVVDGRWSCGRTTSIRSGSRLFWLRQGVEPRGIFGSGWATSDWYPDTHWSGTGTIHFVDVGWDVLLEPGIDEIIPRSLLALGSFAHVHWNTQQSGIRISRAVAIELEGLWERTHGRPVTVLERE